MIDFSGFRRFCSLEGRSQRLQWALLAGLSIVLVGVLELVRLPAALMLGAMISAIVISALDGRVRVPRYPYLIAQSVIGCMIADSIPLSIIDEVTRDWPVFLSAVVLVIALAAFLGWLLARWQVLPGVTAIWGSSPGGASAITVMAGDYGADVRLVAFMQYLRVVCVAGAASVIARIWVSGPLAEAEPIIWFPAIDGLAFAETAGLFVGGVLLARLTKLPGGPILIPLVMGAVLQDTGLMRIELPPWLLAMSYAVIGWSIGLRFTPEIVRHAMRAFPRVLSSILLLIAACGGLAAALVFLLDVDPLTAYLATSPGGLDSVAIIAASSPVDLPFIMSMQTARFVMVLLFGPPLARFIAKRFTVPEAAE